MFYIPNGTSLRFGFYAARRRRGSKNRRLPLRRENHRNPDRVATRWIPTIVGVVVYAFLPRSSQAGALDDLIAGRARRAQCRPASTCPYGYHTTSWRRWCQDGECSASCTPMPAAAAMFSTRVGMESPSSCTYIPAEQAPVVTPQLTAPTQPSQLPQVQTPFPEAPFPEAPTNVSPQRPTPYPDLPPAPAPASPSPADPTVPSPQQATPSSGVSAFRMPTSHRSARDVNPGYPGFGHTLPQSGRAQSVVPGRQMLVVSEPARSAVSDGSFRASSVLPIRLFQPATTASDMTVQEWLEQRVLKQRPTVQR